MISEMSYSFIAQLLNDTVGMDDGEYKAFQDYKAMSDKHEYLFKSALIYYGWFYSRPTTYML